MTIYNSTEIILQLQNICFKEEDVTFWTVQKGLIKHAICNLFVLKCSTFPELPSLSCITVITEGIVCKKTHLSLKTDLKRFCEHAFSLTHKIKYDTTLLKVSPDYSIQRLSV